MFSLDSMADGEDETLCTTEKIVLAESGQTTSSYLQALPVTAIPVPLLQQAFYM